MLPPTTWLVQSKLRAPLPRADAIPRPRLLQQLDAAVSGAPLTLVTAPAGAGKTMLLSSWLASRQGSRAGSGPGAEQTASAQEDAPTPDAQFSTLGLQALWLSLDAEDDDPALFLAGLVAALSRVAPRVGDEVEAALATGVDPRTQLVTLVGVLINALHAQLSAPAVLVLDDLHAVSHQGIHQALGYLVERLPPQLRLVLATRHEPSIGLPRLRARRLVAELRLAQLRFTEREAAELLNARLGLHLSHEQVRAVYERTEGWAAGVGLLAATLESSAAAAEQDRLIAGMAGSDRAIFEYLAEEVLERQDPFVRMFLLETAILPELSPAACAAVTGREDAAAILDQLYRRNLFLVELGGPQSQAGRAAAQPHAVERAPLYRYHDLFIAFLREQLAHEHPAWLRELHRRAARYAPQPARAVQHYLQAGLPEEAAAVVEAAGDGLLRQGAGATLAQLIESLPAETRDARPRLIALYGLSLTYSWQLAQARPWLERAVRELAASGEAVLHDEILAALADTVRMLGEYPAARATYASALTGSLRPPARARLLLSGAWQSLADGDGPGVARALEAMLGHLEQQGDASALYFLASGYHVPFLVVPGGVSLAERFCRLLAAYSDRPGGPLQAANDALSAWCAVVRGRTEQGYELAERALALGDSLGGLPWLQIDLAILPWLIPGMRGDLAAARQGFEQFIARLDSSADKIAAQAWKPVYHMLFAKVEWHSGDEQHMRDAVSRLLSSAAPTDWPAAESLRACGQAILALREHAFPEAERLLREAVALQEQHLEMRLGCDARVLLAHLYLTWQRHDSALAVFAAVLADHEREQTGGLLLLEGPQLVAPLLRLAIARGMAPAGAPALLAQLQQSAPAERPAAAVELDEALTARELEVLRLLVAGASNQAIANTLVISLHTVKRHVTNILQKLDATSRLDAVARARSLGLA
jgi:LuxR family maltose regulon positive regulatory protein